MDDLPRQPVIGSGGGVEPVQLPQALAVGMTRGGEANMTDPKRPETDPGASQPGDRAYEDLPVRGATEGPLSPGATEPGDMGEPDAGRDEDRPHEHPREDGAGYRG